MKTLLSSILALSLLGAVPAFAHDMSTHGDPAIQHDGEAVHVGDLEITGAFTRATLPNQPTGGGYLTITNHGDAEDTLIGGSAAFAGEVQVHEMAMNNDVMSMRHLPDGLTIPAGETVTLQPSGFHLMFMRLNTSLVEGETASVILEFEHAGAVELVFKIAAAGARSMTGHEAHSGEGSH